MIRFADKSSDLARATVLLVGDVSGARDIKDSALRNGYAHSFRFVRDEIRRADVAFCNLECVVSTPLKHKKIDLSVPSAFPKVLSESGFDVVSVANNHFFDAGIDNARLTERTLRQYGVAAVGGVDGGGYEFSVRGIRIGFLAFVVPELSKSNAHQATFGIKSLDQIRRARASVDCLIVSIHWGEEYKPATDRQRQVAASIIGAGADVIVGHHPHVTQEIDPVAPGKWVFYSLGNFMFDSHIGGDSTHRGFAVKLQVSKSGVQGIETMPYEIDEEGTPRWTTNGRAVMANLIKRVAADKYSHIDFKPPESVADAAAKGLEYRQKASPSNKGGLTPAEASKQGIGSGVQRAVNLKNRDNISPDVIRQMVAFFSRHEKNKSIAPENKSTPWNDKGHVAWLIWGGDPGKAWAEKVRSQMDAADENAKKKAALKSVTSSHTNKAVAMASAQRVVVRFVESASSRVRS